MIRALDPSKFGYGAVAFVVNDAIVAGWIRDRRDERGCSAWVLWGGVTYLCAKSAGDRETAIQSIGRWIQVTTTPEMFDQIPNALAGPWLERSTPPT